jgi:cytochrome c biogenesis protein
MIACSVKRLPATIRLMATKQRQLNESLFQSLPIKERFDLEEPFDVVKERVRASFVREFKGADALDIDRDLALYWDRGKYSKLGPIIIHTSILLIMIGALIGFKWGFKGQIQLKEGQTGSIVTLFGKGGSRPLGFQIRCDRFKVSLYNDGTPRDYRSYVSILEEGHLVLQEAIRVNHPLRYQGISFYQATYGLDGIRSLLFYVKKIGEEKGDNIRVRIGERIPLSDGNAHFEVLQYVPNLNRFGPAAFITLYRVDRDPEAFWVMKHYQAFGGPHRQGKEIFKLVDVDERYWTGLQVTQDPGQWWVWMGSGLMVIGFAFSFAMSHRKVWLLIRGEGKGTEVLLAATATKNLHGLEGRIRRWIQRFSELGLAQK